MKKVKHFSFLVAVILIPTIFAACSSSKSGNPANSSNKKDALRFVVLTDTQGHDGGINSEVLNDALSEIKKISPQPSFAVVNGDLTAGKEIYSKEKEELQNFRNTVTRYYPIEFFYPVFGNHEGDAGAEGELAFEEVFPEFKANFLDEYHKTVYYFDRSDTRFYVLNTSHKGEKDTISDGQLNWIRANEDSGKKNTIYFFHQPAYPTGVHIGSSLDENKLQRDKLWKVIDSSKKPIVFCGHEHNYSRRHIDSDFNETIDGQSFGFKNSVYQVTAGLAGGSPNPEYYDNRDVDVAPIPDYNYAVVDISGSGIEVTVYNLQGKVIDRFEQ